ncbi:MAG: cyclic 2,3-diphosphoglycerate synthase [Halanaerobiales bacterium]
MKRRVLIMGAAGRDFHNFNTFYRDNDDYEVVAFTATQIPDIEGRKYPAELAGENYPEGIPIYAEDDIDEIIEKEDIDEVVFAYSDVSYEYLMSKGSQVMATGADFKMMGKESTMLDSDVPVIAVCAVRTGVGKSQTTRRVSDILNEMGKDVVVIRHPMPYGDLVAQSVQRYENYEDMEKNDCTIEEMEEYEPHIERGNILYAGVDYEKILRAAEKEADVILWDGGNNDMPFYNPDLMITLVDPHRPGHELAYYPGEINLRLADVALINKVATAYPENIEKVRKNIRSVNPEATVVDAASPLFVEDPSLIKNKRVLVVEDGPTLTHGDMEYGAGAIAARKFGAKELIDPRPFAVGSINETFEKYTHLSDILPAMGYGKKQMKELEDTINDSDAEAVVVGTPIDLTKIIDIDKPHTRVKYELQEVGKPNLQDIIEKMNL